MKIKIAVPNNDVYKPLYKNYAALKEQHNIEIYPVSETLCGELLLANKVDAALINPLQYSLGLMKADYRIIPGPILAAYGFTGIGHIYFNEAVRDLTTCGSPEPDDFIIKMASLLFNERYKLNPEIKKISGSADDILSTCDCCISFSKSEKEGTLDISELWSDTFEFAMPLALWTVREEEYPEDIKQIISLLADKELPKEQIINIADSLGDTRSGSLFWHWNKDIEYSLEQTMQILYYYQIAAEIAAVKLFRRD